MAPARRRAASVSWKARLSLAVVAASALAGTAAAQPAPTARMALGEPLEAKLEWLEGGRLRLSELRGRPLLLDLWATWCLPCREQSRILHALDDELALRDVAVLSVNQGESRRVVADFAAAHPGEFPAALDRRQVVSRLLDVGELPALVLLDRTGSVVGIRLGLTQEADLLELLSAVDGEGTTRGAAADAGHRAAAGD